MQEIDRAAIDVIGIPRLVLMEHAGLAIARQVQVLQPAPPRPILACCGTGFNGGDGLSAARHLHAAGYSVRIIVTGRVDQLREEPATYARIAKRLEMPVAELSRDTAFEQVDRWIADCALLIDALLGIGMRGTIREPVRSLIERMNRSGKPIVAADIPSGLDGDTGCVQGVAVKAAVTVSFGRAKQGCLAAEGPAHTGSLIVDAITIPYHLLVEAS